MTPIHRILYLVDRSFWDSEEILNVLDLDRSIMDKAILEELLLPISNRVKITTKGVSLLNKLNEACHVRTEHECKDVDCLRITDSPESYCLRCYSITVARGE